MKNIRGKTVTFLLVPLLTALFLASCASSPEGTENVVARKKDSGYTLIKIDEDVDFLRTRIEYPEFSSCPELSRRIKNTVESDWKSFRSYSQSGWAEISSLNDSGTAYPAFEYNTTCQVTYSGSVISVLLNNYTFSGGAHGSTSLTALNYDSAEGKFISITEASGLSYNQISEICREELYRRLIDNDKRISTASEIADMKENINTGAFPQAGNYQIFTLSGKRLTVYFEPYSVAPYVYGIQKVEIPLK